MCVCRSMHQDDIPHHKCATYIRTPEKYCKPMFKKRKVKAHTSKRKREVEETHEHSSDSDGLSDLNIKSKQKRCNTNSDNEETVGIEDIIAKDAQLETALGKPQEIMFKPDTMVDELHQQLKHKEHLFSKKSTQTKDSEGNKIYQGLISTKSKKEELVKPVSAHIKQNFVTDYQRDVCKDFLKHGYCGFGDTCKFIHVRDEYQKVNKPESKPWEKAAKRSKRF